MPRVLNYYLNEGHTFNGVYYPPVHKYIANRGGMTPKIIVIHIQEGSNWGSWTHFRNVSASCTVMIAKNGDIWNTVPEHHGPWTNGDVKSPTAKGQGLRNKYGSDPNRYSLTIETEGFTGEWPKRQAQLDSVVWQVKQWMKKYGIPVENIVRHADFNTQTRRFCPGDAFFNYVINAVKGSPTKPEPVSNGLGNIPGFDGTKDVVIDGKKYHAQKRVVTTVGPTNVRQWASTESNILETINGKKNVLGWVEGEEVDGVDLWWITEHGRMWAGATEETPIENGEPKPTDPKPPAENPKILTGKNIYNGRVFYSAGADETGRDVTVSENTHLYRYAARTSRKEAEANKESKHRAFLWCYGDSIDGENTWWLVGTGAETNPFEECLRLPAAHTRERPQ